jgi:hypothetical protein
MSDLEQRLRGFGEEWPKGSHNGDEIHEITNVRGSFAARASDLRQAADRLRQYREALEPFVRHLNEMKFDLDNHGNELPGGHAVGWIYVTNDDFRRARTALKETTDVD